jgi:hypothetical protein
VGERGGFPGFEGSFNARARAWGGGGGNPLFDFPIDGIPHVIYQRTRAERVLVLRSWTISAGGLDKEQNSLDSPGTFIVVLSWSRAGVVAADGADTLDYVISTNNVEFATTTLPAVGWNKPGYSQVNGVMKAPDDLVDGISLSVETTGDVPVNGYDWAAMVNVWGMEV